jgi:hypothetical protein
MGNTHKIVLTDDEQFFYDHAGCSRAMDEPAWSGRARVAVLLAEAEATAKRKGWEITWEIDFDADTEPSDSYFVSGAPHWQASLWAHEDGVPVHLAGLGSIDLGFAGGSTTEPASPWHNAYARVVEAELASEAMG